MSNICLQEIQSIHDWWASFPFFLPLSAPSPPIFSPPIENENISLSINSIAASGFNVGISVPHSLHHRSSTVPSLLSQPHSHLDYLLLLTERCRKEKLKGSAFFFGFYWLYGKGSGCKKPPPELLTGFSVFWSVTSDHYSDATRSLLPPILKFSVPLFLIFFPPSQPHQHHPRHEHDFVFKESRTRDNYHW